MVVAVDGWERLRQSAGAVNPEMAEAHELTNKLILSAAALIKSDNPGPGDIAVMVRADLYQDLENKLDKLYNHIKKWQENNG